MTCNGQWGATGQVNTVLLDKLLFHPYFKKGGPRSTGKEDFNLPWLEHNLVTMEEIAPEDVQATLVEFTCTSITRAIEQSLLAVSEVYVCGGGAYNAHLMARLQSHLAPATVQSTAAIGIEPDWVEAATFAWLAKQTLEGLPGNSSVVTGAAGLASVGRNIPRQSLEIGIHYSQANIVRPQVHSPLYPQGAAGLQICHYQIALD